MNNLTINKKTIFTFMTLVILLIGLIVSVYLVQTKQIFKSRATADIDTALTLTEDNGQPIQYTGNNTYQTSSDHVNISIKNLQELINH